MDGNSGKLQDQAKKKKNGRRINERMVYSSWMNEWFDAMLGWIVGWMDVWMRADFFACCCFNSTQEPTQMVLACQMVWILAIQCNNNNNKYVRLFFSLADDRIRSVWLCYNEKAILFKKK